MEVITPTALDDLLLLLLVSIGLVLEYGLQIVMRPVELICLFLQEMILMLQMNYNLLVAITDMKRFN